MDMLGDEQDSFEQQQSLFRPTELMYCRNLIDLLTEELDQVRQCLGQAQRANLVLVAERDGLVAERVALTAEVHRHRLRYVQFVQEENQQHVPRVDRLVPDDRDDPLSRAQRHILRLESMNSVLHADLVRVRAELQVLLTERGKLAAAGGQHG
ncbi:hypothetical protein [Pseudomonas oryzihabitans]|uniref:hypothetical protein n=1 Tax=Pseudomonas oryzihabitans TaxID=47885 RepID=UPI0028574226|nr:hypothetical protein [Pseudomonas psychrotolerans]MDR6679517.1 hypothetical protein [Pseudomonas psychrotolerans]